MRNAVRSPTLLYVAADGITLDQVHRIGVHRYHEFIETGIFDNGVRVELIDGLIVNMSPKSGEHEMAIAWLNRWLTLAIDPKRYRLGVGWPLTLERQQSEPEPDLTVTRIDTPRRPHPITAELVIEVSVSSLRHDLGIKRWLYGQAGVTEYWVVDVEGRRIVRHREPRPSGYRLVDELHEGIRLVASALELPPLDTRELFAAAHA